MTDKQWNAALAVISSIRFQITNRAGMPADERAMLRTDLWVALCELARHVKNEQEAKP